jgi:hypothetical protein
MSLSVMRGRALALKPPRVLLTGQQMGATVGPPGDVATQRAILEQALRLLEQHDAIILATFAPDEATT